MIEISWNKVEDTFKELWYSIEISYSKTEFHPTHRHVITISIIIFSIYIRWGKKSKKRIK